MKYLFFFNGQLLLLCCVYCKIAIQDFVTGLHEKIRKIYEYTDGLNPSVFHRELKKIYVIVPLSPTDYAHPKAHACQTRVRLHKYRRIEKSGGIFELFWCAFQLISDSITDRI
jgi:hypothetical protein